MPYIDVKLTKNLSDTDENNLKSKLGEIISLFPGKSENWLMCCVDSGKKMWFQGDNSTDSAFVDVKLFGAVDNNSANDFTSKLCEYFERELNISPSRVYVRFSGGNSWGWNGSNF